MSNRINKQDLDILLSQNRKMSRNDIIDFLNIPESLARTYKGVLDNFDLLSNKEVKNSSVKTYFVSFCWHVPFHDKTLYTGFKQLLKDLSPDGFVLGGDFLDMGSLSEYERGKISNTGVTLEDEYREANVVLDELDFILGENKEKFFLYGNHCDRYFRWKKDVNNSKYGDLLDPSTALKLVDRGYVVKDNYHNDYIELGSLQILHGYFFNIHCAKQHLDKLRRNCMFGHTHRSQMYREGDFAAYNSGFMGDINAPCFSYASRAMRESWSNGFSLVHLSEGNFFVEQIDVVNSHFVYNGKKY